MGGILFYHIHVHGGPRTPDISNTKCRQEPIKIIKFYAKRYCLLLIIPSKIDGLLSSIYFHILSMVVSWKYFSQYCLIKYWRCPHFYQFCPFVFQVIGTYLHKVKRSIGQLKRASLFVRMSIFEMIKGLFAITV